MKINKINPVFVNRIPTNIKDGILYISMETDSVIHKCACGCGETVSTPLGIAGWTLSYNSEGVSLYPSIGNYSFKCKSHYYIKKNSIIWCNKIDKKRKPFYNLMKKLHIL